MADSDSRRGHSYVTAEILEWSETTHDAKDAGLARAFATPAREGVPAIQLAPPEARFLTLLIRLAHAKRIVEVGTLVGYSAIAMARASRDVRVDTIEVDAKHAALAVANIEAAGLSSQVRVHHGAGLDVLATLGKSGPVDAVFLDADKANYPGYGQWAATHVRPGGLLIADNVFLFGRLLGDSVESRAMREFHERAAASFDTTVLTTPDGLLVGVRKSAA